MRGGRNTSGGYRCCGGLIGLSVGRKHYTFSSGLGQTHMSDHTWTVLLPSTIHPDGPTAIEDFAMFRSRDEYGTLAELVEEAWIFDAIVVRVAPIPAELIRAASQLKVIAKHGVGVDNIDIETASHRGVVVCNTPAANAPAVAEHTITLLLAASKRLLAADARVREGDWDHTECMNRELGGTTLGLFGFGRIARLVAERAGGIGMRCVAYDPYVNPQDAPDDVEFVSSKAELMERADHLSVHTPLTEETRHAISSTELGNLPEDAIVLNLARGEIIDEQALIEALEEETIGGVGLDVFAKEPPSRDNRLLESDRSILTPHIGAVTEEAMRRMSVGAAENVRTVYNGGLPSSTVNRKAL